jgi:hypothetical protein
LTFPARCQLAQKLNCTRKRACAAGPANFDWRNLRGLGKLLAWRFRSWFSRKEHDMDTTPRVAPQEFADSMKQEMEQYLKQVMEAVNRAVDGEWIAGSEEGVRDLSAGMRRRVFEAAVQQRIDAAEAAFPPSAQRDDGQAVGQ